MDWVKDYMNPWNGCKRFVNDCTQVTKMPWRFFLVFSSLVPMIWHWSASFAFSWKAHGSLNSFWHCRTVDCKIPQGAISLHEGTCDKLKLLSVFSEEAMTSGSDCPDPFLKEGYVVIKRDMVWLFAITITVNELGTSTNWSISRKSLQVNLRRGFRWSSICCIVLIFSPSLLQ